MTTTENNTTTTDTSVENLQRLCKVAAEMLANGDKDGCQAVLEAMHKALGLA